MTLQEKYGEKYSERLKSSRKSTLLHADELTKMVEYFANIVEKEFDTIINEDLSCQFYHMPKGYYVRYVDFSLSNENSAKMCIFSPNVFSPSDYCFEFSEPVCDSYIADYLLIHIPVSFSIYGIKMTETKEKSANPTMVPHLYTLSVQL